MSTFQVRATGDQKFIPINPTGSNGASVTPPMKVPKPQPGLVYSKNFINAIDQIAETLVNPDRLPIYEYERMVDTDETISSAHEFTTLCCLSLIGDYTHPKATIQKFVRKMLADLAKDTGSGWHVTLTDILTAMWAGFSVTEDIPAEANGGIVLDSTVTLNPRTVTFDLDLIRQQPKFIWQWRWTAWQVQIPSSKVCVYTHRKRFNNPYGRSRLKSVWKNWIIKDSMLKAWGATIEKYAAPLVIARVDNGDQEVDIEGGGTQIYSKYVMQQLNNLSSKSVAVLQGPKESHDISVHQLNRPVGTDFENLQNHMNKMIMRGMLMPSLVFDSGQTGSFALGKKHFDLFWRGMVRLLDELIPVLVYGIIRKYIVWNFGEQPDNEYGTFLINTIKDEDLKLFMEAIYSATQSGYISPKVQSDLDSIREYVGMKLVDVSEIPDAPSPPNIKESVSKQDQGGDNTGNSPPSGNPKQPSPGPKVPGKPEGRPAKERS